MSSHFLKKFKLFILFSAIRLLFLIYTSILFLQAAFCSSGKFFRFAVRCYAFDPIPVLRQPIFGAGCAFAEKTPEMPQQSMLGQNPEHAGSERLFFSKLFPTGGKARKPEDAGASAVETVKFRCRQYSLDGRGSAAVFRHPDTGCGTAVIIHITPESFRHQDEPEGGSHYCFLGVKRNNEVYFYR